MALRTYKAIHRQADHPAAVLRRTPVHKLLLYCVLFARHLRDLAPLLLARRGSNLHRLVTARPEILKIALAPYVSANWGVRTRVQRIVDHHRTVAEIGGVTDFSPDLIVDIVELPVVERRYRITLDQARWLMCEGSLVMSLWDGPDRIFHLAFCLSTEAGKRIAYIGSLQGRPEIDIENFKVDVLNRYRLFTKAAGMRPRDFLVEVFRMFCKALDVTEIRAVSDVNHPQRLTGSDIKLSYDKIWAERGGAPAGDGFFLLPVAASRRNDATIPAKRRAAYARRYSVLDAVEAQLNAVLRSGVELLAPAAA